MTDRIAMETRIETKLQELMEERGWELSDSEHYIIYRKDGITIDMEVDSVGVWRAPTGYQVIFYRSRQYSRRFKVAIDESDYDNPTFTIDEKKLDKKIEEVCAILRERDEAYRKREKQTEENEKRAVEFAAEVGAMLPGYRVEAVRPRTAHLFAHCDSFISITKDHAGTFHLAMEHHLIVEEGELPGLIETLAEHS